MRDSQCGLGCRGLCWLLDRAATYVQAFQFVLKLFLFIVPAIWLLIQVGPQVRDDLGEWTGGRAGGGCHPASLARRRARIKRT